jgi:hypothetical protein
MQKNKKYTLLTTALQDHLIKELNLNLNEPLNKPLKPINPTSKIQKSTNQSKTGKKGKTWVTDLNQSYTRVIID